MNGALPDQEMCEHCSSYDGGWPCHMCGALSPRDRQNPEALRRAADTIEELRRQADRPPRPPSPGLPLHTPEAIKALKDAFEPMVYEGTDDAFLKALEVQGLEELPGGLIRRIR